MENDDRIVHLYKISRDKIVHLIGTVTINNETTGKFKELDRNFATYCSVNPGVAYKGNNVWYYKPNEMKAVQVLAVYEKERILELRKKIERKKDRIYLLKDRYLELKGELSNGNSKKV